MPLNVRGAVGWAGRAGLGAVAVVIARSVVPALQRMPSGYHRSMTGQALGERLVGRRSGRADRPLRVAVLGAGNVGREVVRSLLSGWEGPTFDLVGVAVRDLPKAEAVVIGRSVEPGLRGKPSYSESRKPFGTIAG